MGLSGDDLGQQPAVAVYPFGSGGGILNRYKKTGIDSIIARHARFHKVVFPHLPVSGHSFFPVPGRTPPGAFQGAEGSQLKGKRACG